MSWSTKMPWLSIKSYSCGRCRIPRHRVPALGLSVNTPHFLETSASRFRPPYLPKIIVAMSIRTRNIATEGGSPPWLVRAKATSEAIPAEPDH